ncbi:hypothetical protein M0R45_020164 [Rubus argutus]|uniref:Endonuclease/exonuclease/phosphatase domain-containing protein n=1 Tax=Rubus argutus TaxID=59490 RepID=A0AAW1X847_RUBAR
MGDFNEIISSSEKSGGPLRSNPRLQAFRSAISDCNLEDMGAVGGSFTWCNSSTQERLDRGLASPAWRDVFSFSRVVHLAPSRSDHVPLMLEVRTEPCVVFPRRRRFRFEEMWTNHSMFSQVMEQSWTQPQMGNPLLQVCQRIKDTGSTLLEWDRAVFSSRKADLELTRQQLQQLLQKPYDPADQLEKTRLSGKLYELISVSYIGDSTHVLSG